MPGVSRSGAWAQLLRSVCWLLGWTLSTDLRVITTVNCDSACHALLLLRNSRVSEKSRQARCNICISSFNHHLRRQRSHGPRPLASTPLNRLSEPPRAPAGPCTPAHTRHALRGVVLVVRARPLPPMLVPINRRPYALVVLLAVSSGLLLLLHQQAEHLPFSLSTHESTQSATHPGQERLDGICQAPDPFEQEYGRTNLRMSRAYEGASRVHVRKV